MSPVHLMNEEGGAVLCGAAKAHVTTVDTGAVTCPLCATIQKGRFVGHRLIDLAEHTVTVKLAELQRDPTVRALTRFAQSVLEADGSLRASRSKRGPHH